MGPNFSRKKHNKKMHATKGNKSPRTAIVVWHWNCNKGLLNHLNFPTDKVSEIANFISSHNLDILAITEANLHGPKSRTMRANPVNIHTINNALRIPGYTIHLPDSWPEHQTARIIIYVRDIVTITMISTNNNIKDLPIIAITARKSKEAQTNIVACYREYTGAVSGLNSIQAQTERLNRILDVWRKVEQLNKDTIILGDINLDYKKWAAQNAPNNQLVDMVKETQIRATLSQLVKEDTRIQLVGGNSQSSIIDHVYTNCPDKLRQVKVVSVGDSDHLGQVVEKTTTVPQDHQQTYRIRQHKPTSAEALKADLFLNNVPQLILDCDNIEKAAETFHREITYYANKHMPVKTKVIKANSKPFISEETKELIQEKKAALESHKANPT